MIKAKIIIDLNADVSFELTDYGKDILMKQMIELDKKVKANKGKGYTTKEMEKFVKEYNSTQLWSFIDRFGEYIYIGNNDNVIKGNKISIELEKN